MTPRLTGMVCGECGGPMELYANHSNGSTLRCANAAEAWRRDMAAAQSAVWAKHRPHMAPVDAPWPLLVAVGDVFPALLADVAKGDER